MYGAAMLVSLSRTPTWRPKQDSLWQYTFSTPVYLVLLQIILKVIYEYFPLELSNKTLFSAETFREYVYNRVLNHLTTRALQHQYFRFKIFVTSRANQELITMAVSCPLTL